MDESHVTPLSIAIAQKNFAFVDWLLNEGADPNGILPLADFFMTPLMLAESNGFAEIEARIKAAGGENHIQVESLEEYRTLLASKIEYSALPFLKTPQLPKNPECPISFKSLEPSNEFENETEEDLIEEPVTFAFTLAETDTVFELKDFLRAWEKNGLHPSEQRPIELQHLRRLR